MPRYLIFADRSFADRSDKVGPGWGVLHYDLFGVKMKIGGRVVFSFFFLSRLNVEKNYTL